jgi:hypothetical protein
VLTKLTIRDEGIKKVVFQSKVLSDVKLNGDKIEVEDINY